MILTLALILVNTPHELNQKCTLYVSSASTKWQCIDVNWPLDDMSHCTYCAVLCHLKKHSKLYRTYMVLQQCRPQHSCKVQLEKRERYFSKTVKAGQNVSGRKQRRNHLDCTSIENMNIWSHDCWLFYLAFVDLKHLTWYRTFWICQQYCFWEMYICGNHCPEYRRRAKK